MMHAFWEHVPGGGREGKGWGTKLPPQAQGDLFKDAKI